MEQNNSERRKYVRVGVSLLISYIVIDGSQESKESITENISGGGMMIPLKEKLAVGTYLKLQLDLLKKRKKIQLEAKVVWLRPIPDEQGYTYKAGIEFINLNFAKRNVISNYVQYLDREQLLKGFSAK